MTILVELIWKHLVCYNLLSVFSQVKPYPCLFFFIKVYKKTILLLLKCLSLMYHERKITIPLFKFCIEPNNFHSLAYVFAS